jgi:cytochrome bd-type quinol oxidase subunit 2
MSANSLGASVYGLCVLTSLACAALMWRSYRRSHRALLLWTGLCFAGLAVNGLLVIVDEVVITTVDLRVWRAGAAALAVTILLVGLVWER